MVLGPIVSIVISTMENMGYLGLLILMILESLALPIPSEVILPFSGYLIYLGKLNLVLTIIDATVASIIGSLVEYALSYYIGYSVVLKVGKFMGLTESHLKLAESWFNRYGWLSIIAAKFVPGVRALISVPAGIVRM
ncbi:MAG: DedA family protein, partial [Caldivirga sp.]